MTTREIAERDRAGRVRLREGLVMSALPRLTILALLARTGADPDLFGHLAFGRDIVRALGVHRSDPYSFTSDLAWVNHEWLAEATMWLAYAAGGAPGLVALKLLMAAIAGAFLLATWRPYRLRLVPREGLLFATALATWPQLASARPQMFSVAAFGWLLFELEQFRRGNARAVWRLPLLFALWVNLHGGWLVGAGVLVIFVAAVWLDRSCATSRQVVLLLAALASAAATLVNPYGVRMLGFLAGTVRPDRSDIVEWSPITALPPVVILLMAVPIVLGIAAALRGGRAVPLSSLAICLILAMGALRVARLAGFCGLAVGFLLAPFLVVGARGEAEAPADDAGVRSEPKWNRRVESMLAAALIVVAVGVFGRRISMAGAWLPEAEAALAVKANRLQGRMLTWFNYGEYAIWHFWPSLRVSNDGRRETVYSETVRRMHSTIYAGGAGAHEALARLNVDHAWLPVESPMVVQLQRRGWFTVFEGLRSVVLSRRVKAAVRPPPAPAGPRSFPGP